MFLGDRELVLGLLPEEGRPLLLPRVRAPSPGALARGCVPGGEKAPDLTGGEGPRLVLPEGRWRGCGRDGRPQGLAEVNTTKMPLGYFV